MSKKNESDNGVVYNFSFSLRKTNPFEKKILKKLNELIENGCSKKDAIMTLMSVSVMDYDILDAPISESVQFQKENQKEKIIKKSIDDINTNMDEEPEILINKINRKTEDTNKEIKHNQQPQLQYEKKPVNNEPEKKLNSTDKYNTPETEAKLQVLLRGMYT